MLGSGSHVSLARGERLEYIEWKSDNSDSMSAAEEKQLQTRELLACETPELSSGIR
jgi:hypothetical protein